VQRSGYAAAQALDTAHALSRFRALDLLTALIRAKLSIYSKSYPELKGHA
jgi:hypothetical protein